MQIIRKITTKLVSGGVDFDALVKSESKREDLLKVWGIANRAKPGSSEYGDYVRFSGQFRATDLRTGAEYASGSCILPGVAQDLLAGALDKEEAESVQFAFMVSVRYEPSAVVKYVYEVESLLPIADSDPIQLLTNQLKQLEDKSSAPAVEEKHAESKARK